MSALTDETNERKAMTTIPKQAKMTWSPDEPGIIWGYPQGTVPGETASYHVAFGLTDYQAICYPRSSEGIHSRIIGSYKTQEEAKAACAVDALKYL